MSLYVVGAAPVFFILTMAAISKRRRPAMVPVEPRPAVYRSIRLLRNDDEVREIATQACERERLIAIEADRRARRFDALTRPKSAEAAS